jgi:hypothetical protein
MRNSRGSVSVRRDFGYFVSPQPARPPHEHRHLFVIERDLTHRRLPPVHQRHNVVPAQRPRRLGPLGEPVNPVHKAVLERSPTVYRHCRRGRSPASVSGQCRASPGPGWRAYMHTYCKSGARRLCSDLLNEQYCAESVPAAEPVASLDGTTASSSTMTTPAPRGPNVGTFCTPCTLVSSNAVAQGPVAAGQGSPKGCRAGFPGVWGRSH